MRKSIATQENTAMIVTEKIEQSNCHECNDAVRRIVYAELCGFKVELCSRCAEDLRLKLGKALGVGGRSRARDRVKKKRCGGGTEIWDDLT